jgi:hypothetical protein
MVRGVMGGGGADVRLDVKNRKVSLRSPHQPSVEDCSIVTSLSRGLVVTCILILGNKGQGEAFTALLVDVHDPLGD